MRGAYIATTSRIDHGSQVRRDGRGAGSRLRAASRGKSARRTPAAGAFFAALTLVTLVALVTFTAGEARADKPHRLEWKYPRFRSVEYIAAAFVTGTGLYMERAMRGLPDNNLLGGILLDNITRDALVAKTPEGRRTAGMISDFMWHPTQYYAVADAIFTPLVTDRGNIDVAMQMTLINWQVQGVAFLITRATHRAVGRTRPIRAGCKDNPDYDEVCSPGYHSGLTGSFLSGHTAMSFAGAALTCSHHIALPLYGGNGFDAGICALSLTSAATIGALRVVADKHWWSDVIAGATVGLATGFGLPFLLHYGQRTPSKVTILPLVSPTTTGISVVAQP